MKIDDILNKAEPPLLPTLNLTVELANEMEHLEPGRVLTIKLRGRDFIIIDRDDFEHIAGKGGMALSKKGSVSNG